MRIPLLIALSLIVFQLSAQRLENIHAEAINGGERVMITYDISGVPANRKFKISVYSSHDNYATPLTHVTGDINNVGPGVGKRIEWNARNEMNDYNGDITFELHADPIALPLSVKTPAGVKKGKATTITYEGVMPGESVKLELVRNGLAVSQVGVTTDESNYKWNVPSDADKASDYQIRLTAGTRTATSELFSIKSKSRAWMYIVPAVVVAGIVVFIVTKPKGSGDSDNTVENNSTDLPSPPDPPN